MGYIQSKKNMDVPRDAIAMMLSGKRTSSIDEWLSNSTNSSWRWQRKSIPKWWHIHSPIRFYFQTSSTLIIFLSNMLLYPDIQMKIQLELDQQLDKETPIMPDDRAKLPYLDAAWQESKRFYPSNPLGISQSSIFRLILRPFHRCSTSYITRWSLQWHVYSKKE